MRKNLLFLKLVLIVSFCTHHLGAQAADVSLPKQRDSLVEAAEKLVASRTATLALGDKVPNPFEWPVTEDLSAQTLADAPPAAVNAGVTSPEFLARLAALIPVTGTAFLGDQGILLLGQKRLKVGDAFTISFEGQSHELSIAEISGASFTVRRGALLHTRPIQLSSSNTRNTRP